MRPPGLPALTALASRVSASDPDRCRWLLGLLERGMSVLDPEMSVRHLLEEDPPPGDDVVVLALGKAAPAMARGAAAALGGRARRYLVVSDHAEPVPADAELMVTSHPVPDGSSLEAGRRLLEAAGGPADHILLLISGGGSSLAEVPAPDLALDDLVEVYDLLLRHGVPIEDANIVRTHLSSFKGGKLAAAAAAPTTTVVLSDVGPRLDLVASGPSVPAESRPHDALEVLRRHGLLERCPSPARAVLGSKAQPPAPPPGRVLAAGDGAAAARAIADAGDAAGQSVSVVTASLQGEAADAARWALEAVPEGEVGVLAGETTVSVRGSGRGGRNQEAALAAALQLDHGAFVSFGTDGVDGPTDAAGAYVDASTVGRIRAGGIDPESALADNDSHTALDAAGALLRTGPTGINVADLWLVDNRPDSS